MILPCQGLAGASFYKYAVVDPRMQKYEEFCRTVDAIHNEKPGSDVVAWRARINASLDKYFENPSQENLDAFDAAVKAHPQE